MRCYYHNDADGRCVAGFVCDELPFKKGKEEVCDICERPTKKFIQCFDDKCCPSCAAKFEKAEKERK